jgi:hypothetical protein
VANSEAAAVAASAGDQQAVDWLRCALGLEASEAPFPWQFELLHRFHRGAVVSTLDIPTGLGKTAVMAVWLVARAHREGRPSAGDQHSERRRAAALSQVANRLWDGALRAVAGYLTQRGREHVRKLTTSRPCCAYG